MVRQPEPKAQAQLLTSLMEMKGLKLKHQEALEIIAVLHGYANWQAMKALQSRTAIVPQRAEPVEPAPALPIPGPEHGRLYDVRLSVDASMTGIVRVRALNAEQALGLAQQHAVNTGGRGFEVDEGNYRGPSDYYLTGDMAEDVVPVKEEVSVTGDREEACASWQEGPYHITITCSKNYDIDEDEADGMDPDAVYDRRIQVEFKMPEQFGKAGQLPERFYGEEFEEAAYGLDSSETLRGMLKREIREGNWRDAIERVITKLNREVKAHLKAQEKAKK